eukprot:scaffold104684_cov69-Phaeocystis_antarctica.AAC.2
MRPLVPCPQSLHLGTEGGTNCSQLVLRSFDVHGRRSDGHRGHGHGWGRTTTSSRDADDKCAPQDRMPCAPHVCSSRAAGMLAVGILATVCSPAGMLASRRVVRRGGCKFDGFTRRRT